MRSLTKNLFNELKNGELHSLLEYVQNDDTLDMEFRNNSITIYYRGGNLLSVTESKKNDDSYQYTWKGINEEYLKDYKQKHEDAEQFEEYIPEAKHIIDRYICKIKNHLGEKEIQQLIVRENNYSPNSQDTDYFIVDMEYEETQCKGRFDLIALRWDSKTPARKSNEVSLAVIEVKQGYNSIRTNKKTPGLKSHLSDFNDFDWTPEIKNDFLQIFKQKCELGLILANEKIEGINQDFKLELDKDKDIDFICLLANYKKASTNLHNELKDIKKENKSCKFIQAHYMGYGLYADEIFEHLIMTTNFLEEKKKEQADRLKKYRASLFDNAEGIGYSQKNNKWFDYILKSQFNDINLYKGIRQNAIEYFKKYNIAWWQCMNESNVPTGHLVSSQIHCLNHLFALRTDKEAVKLIIEKATGMQFDEVLPSLIDNDEHSYISFEFALNNDKLLEENDKGWKRGTLCTSIDVMIMARKGENKWLIPIEWKYTETYSETDLTNKNRIERYAHLIENSARLKMPDNNKIAHSIYFKEPYYELMRQTLLCEQLIIKAGYADDFFHINIIPEKHTELREAVETGFIPMLNDKTKFKIVDPKDFLTPIKENNLYPELIDYLEKRYW